MQYNITYREKDGGWQYIISYKDTNGKWKQKSKQGFEKSRKGKLQAKEAAENALEELKNKLEFQTSLNQDHNGITFLEFANMFINHEELYKEPGTIRSYKFAIKRFNIINDIKLCDVTNIHIQNCIDDMLREGFNVATIRLYVSKIRVIFDSAVNHHKLILKSPVENFKIPIRKEETVKRALTKSELSQLLNKIEYRKYYIVSLIAATCGLRLGEILGLTWNDINKDGTISINKQFKLYNDGKYKFGPLKSKNSNRIVPIPPNTLMELNKYKKETPTSIDNRIIQHADNINLSRMLRETYASLGFKISLHELRHTYATMLISSGIDFKTAAKLLGHDIEMTMKTYSHVTDDMMQHANSVIKNIF